MESRSEAFIERRPYCDKGSFRQPIDASFAST